MDPESAPPAPTDLGPLDIRRQFPGLRPSRLRASLEECARPWSATVYRAVPLAYASPEAAFSGEGSRLLGGRWNPPGMIAIYTSLAPEHALLERLALARRRRAPDREVLPTAVVTAEVDVEAMLSWGELPDDTRSRIDPEDVATTLDWTAANGRGACAPGQAFGRLASRSGAEALLVPSAVLPDALVAVLLFDRFRGPGRLRPQDSP